MHPRTRDRVILLPPHEVPTATASTVMWVPPIRAARGEHFPPRVPPSPRPPLTAFPLCRHLSSRELYMPKYPIVNYFQLIMSDDGKGDSKSLGVPTAGRASGTVSPIGSAASSRNVSPAGNTRAQSAPGQLPTELILKVQAQHGRLTLMEEFQGNLPSSREELLEYKAHFNDTFKIFSQVHSYFETVWPADCLNHEYFVDDWYLDTQRTYASLKREIARLCSSLPKETSSSSVRSDTDSHTKLPDISLPEFKGEYSECPTFSDLFKSLILDNPKLSDIEQLHYLRGCLKDAPAQLIASLPLTGAFLTQS